MSDEKKAGSASRGMLEKAIDEHPLALLAGSVVLGAVAATLLPARLGGKIGSRMLGVAALAGDFGATLSSKAWEAAAKNARTGQERLEDLGEKLSDQGGHARRRAGHLGATAGRRALELAEAAAANARQARAEALKRLGSRSGRDHE